jgi:hypothetical protein
MADYSHLKFLLGNRSKACSVEMGIATELWLYSSMVEQQFSSEQTTTRQTLINLTSVQLHHIQ